MKICAWRMFAPMRGRQRAAVAPVTETRRHPGIQSSIASISEASFSGLSVGG